MNTIDSRLYFSQKESERLKDLIFGIIGGRVISDIEKDYLDIRGLSTCNSAIGITLYRGDTVVVDVPYFSQTPSSCGGIDWEKFYDDFANLAHKESAKNIPGPERKIGL